MGLKPHPLNKKEKTMAKLDDYISGLVSSVARARYSADIQVAEVARLYKNDDVLKCFAVPHMRIGDIEIDLPYALDSHTPVQEVLSCNTELMCTRIEQAFYDSYEGVEVPFEGSPKVTQDVRTYVDEISPKIESLGFEYIESNSFQSRLKVTVATWYGYCTEVEIPEKMLLSAVDNITEAIRSAVTVTTTGGMQVIAEANQLQSYDSKAITHVKIKIHEDGMVWAGETLIPE